MKLSKVVERFDEGIVSSVDEKDIPDNAASWSQNVDGETIPGKLIGRYGDTLFTAAASAAIKSMKKNVFLTNSDKTQDLVGYNAADGKLQTISDFFGTIGAITDQLTPGTGKTVAMEVQNDAVHVGYGKTSSEPSKWVGKIEYGQFGGTKPSGIQCVNAELAPPVIFPVLYKTFSDGTYLYGIQFQGTKIFKVTIATGVFTVSKQDFVSTQGLAYNTTYLFLYDKAGTHGILYRLNLADLSIYETYPLDGFITPGGALNTSTGYGQFTDTVISDIEISTAHIWFSAWREEGFVLDGTALGNYNSDFALVYSYAIASLVNGTAFHPANRSPLNSQISGASQGGLVNNAGDPSYFPAKTPLVKAVDANYMGYLTKVVAYVNPDGPGPGIAVGWSVILLSEGLTGYVNLNNASGLLFRLEDGTHAFTSGIKLTGIGADIIYLLSGESNESFYAYLTTGFPWTVAGKAWSASTWITALIATGGDTQAKYGDLTTVYSAYQSQDATYYTIVVVSATGSTGAEHTMKVTGATGLIGSGVFKYYSPLFITTEAFTSTVGNFSTTKRYFYAACFEYDKFQISPFPKYLIPSTVLAGTATNSIKVTVTLTNVSTISARVNAVHIFRAESASTGKYTPDSNYRLVKTIDIIPTINSTADTNWGVHKHTFIFDTGEYGVAYEQETGIAETLSNSTLNYELSTQYQGYHFVARCFNSELVDTTNGASTATKMLFRSKLQCFDQFDWSNDFLVLPKIPTALAAFNGKVYAFADNEIYTINPQGLYIEDIYNGVGCINEQSVFVTEYGMFIIDGNNIYQHDGRTPIPIGGAIKFVTNPNGFGLKSTYLANATTYRPFIGSLLKYNYMLFGFADVTNINSLGVTIFFAYHIHQKRWEYWTMTSTITGISTAATEPGFITGKYGEGYFSCDAGTFLICDSSTTRMQFLWYSKNFTMDLPSSRKRIYKVESLSSGTAYTLTVSYDDGASFGSVGKVYTTRIMLKFVGHTNGTSLVSATSIYYRKLEGETNANI